MLATGLPWRVITTCSPASTLSSSSLRCALASTTVTVTMVFSMWSENRSYYNGAAEGIPVSLLPTPRRAGETSRFVGGAKQRLGLVDAFSLLGGRLAVGDDAGAGLH